MAGETLRSSAVCLSIHPWSKTSHVVQWLTATGRLHTVVKGAVRPKSFFLGQYDLNYTCDILYYVRAQGDVHALREACPVNRRDALRGDWRSLALAGYFREAIAATVPAGEDAAAFLDLLVSALDRLNEGERNYLALLVDFEAKHLRIMGLSPEIASEGGTLALRGERKMQVSREMLAALQAPFAEKNANFLLDLTRVFGVYYTFHAGLSPETRRSVVALISKPN